jgi:hypothetical protein
MRQSLPFYGCGLALLLFSLGLVIIRGETSYSQAPPNATSVRVDRYGLSEVHVNYKIATVGKLSDLYQYYGAQDWMRDGATERGLQRTWAERPSTIFAVFTRQRLFGLITESAIVGIPADARAGVQVRMVRCLKVEPWVGCL